MYLGWWMSSVTWLLYCSTCYSWGISHWLQLSYHQCIPLYLAQRSLSTTSPHSRDDNLLPALTTSDFPPVMWLLWFYTSQYWSNRPTKFVLSSCLLEVYTVAANQVLSDVSFVSRKGLGNISFCSVVSVYATTLCITVLVDIPTSVRI
jgi:hypothetical protein